LVYALAGDGGLAGCYGIQLRDSTLGPSSVGMALDIMVQPDFQGRGLFRKLAQRACDELANDSLNLVYVMSNARADVAHVKGLGWTPLAVFRDYTRKTSGLVPSGRIAVGEIAGFSESDRQLIDRLDGRPAPSRLRLSRSACDLNWRLFENPRYHYQVLRCTVSGAPVGFLALKIFADPVTKVVFGDVVDVLADDDPDLARELLSLALIHFERLGIAQATTWLYTGTPLDEAGRALGFEPVARPRQLSCRLFERAPTWLREAECWQVSMLDTDVY
jgi:hypothetical protein